VKRELLIFEKEKQSLCYYNGLMCLFLPCFYLARAGIDSCYCACSIKRRKPSLLGVMKDFSGGYSCVSIVVYPDMNTSLLMFHISFCRASVVISTSKVTQEICRLKILALIDWGFFLFEKINSCSVLKFNFSLLFRDINYTLLWKYNRVKSSTEWIKCC
jgi:hypothetical protein